MASDPMKALDRIVGRITHWPTPGPLLQEHIEDVATLRRHLEPQWIESAPKDGSEFLGFDALYGWVRCFWSDKQQPFPGDWITLPGHFSARPTHWLTLPAPATTNQE